MSKETRLAFQGVIGAYSHSAGQLFMQKYKAGKPAFFVTCASFEEVFAALAEGLADYAILPLENSSVGSIAINYDLMWGYKVDLVAEVCMPINHYLLGIEGTLIDDVRQVYSHPVALAQCRSLFERQSEMKPVSYFDTSAAAKLVSESNDRSRAAIAGSLAGIEYGLVVLQSDIQDFPCNKTRFGIAKPGCPPIDDIKELPAVPYKISVALELAHEPGTLSNLLFKLAAIPVNLTKIESRPIPEIPFQYRFFLDLLIDGPGHDRAVIDVLQQTCREFKLLGRYLPWADGDAGKAQ